METLLSFFLAYAAPLGTSVDVAKLLAIAFFDSFGCLMNGIMWGEELAFLQTSPLLGVVKNKRDIQNHPTVILGLCRWCTGAPVGKKHKILSSKTTPWWGPCNSFNNQSQMEEIAEINEVSLDVFNCLAGLMEWLIVMFSVIFLQIKIWITHATITLPWTHRKQCHFYHSFHRKEHLQWQVLRQCSYYFYKTQQ